MSLRERWRHVTDRSAEAGEWLRGRLGRRSPGTERILLVGAVVLFAGAAYLGIRNFPRGIDDLRWVPLVAGALGGLPPTLVLNAVEYRTMARIVDRRVPWPRALRVTVVAAAANVLPLPGAVLVRVQALAELDVPYGRAASSAGIVGATWVSTTLVVAGLAQLTIVPIAIVAGTVGVGLLGLAFAYAWLYRRAGAGAPGLAARLAVIETAFVAVSAARLLLILWGLGAEAGWSEAIGLTVAAALAATAGFFPGGLGLRELLAGGIGPLVGLPAATGVLAAVTQRLGSLLALAPVGLWLAMRRAPRGGPSSVEGSAAPGEPR